MIGKTNAIIIINNNNENNEIDLNKIINVDDVAENPTEDSPPIIKKDNAIFILMKGGVDLYDE